MGTPTNSVPIERDVLGSVHRDGVQLAPSVHQAIGLGVQRLTCPRQHPFGSGPLGPASGRFLTTTAWSSSHAVVSPVAFRPPVSASWASCPAEGFRPSYDRPTGPTRPGPRRGFHVPRTRDTTGVGAPYTPRPAVFPRPALTARSPLAAPSSGRALSPRCSSRLPGLEITRHHQEFTFVHPSGLPLARLLPQTERGPLGFYPGLRTPTDKTRRRTPGRGSILNTDRELRTRHDRPPICEFTRYARPRVARENFLYCY